MNRRDFIRHAAGTAAAASLAAGIRPRRSIAGATDKTSDRLRVAVMGINGQGRNLAHGFAALPDAEVACLCDVDRNVIPGVVREVTAQQRHEPRVESDFRRILDDPAIDALVIATPDHWHAPAAILACQAGKHVYVEKPAAHNLREGRLMIDAARKHDRVVQLGTQSRSLPHVIQAVQRLREGAIGDVLVAKAWNSQLRENVGHASPQDPPQGVDYDMWIGPAPFVPYQSNRFHSHWRWWHAFGVGDIGNDGIHDLDIARWGLGVETHPARITASGGKYFFDDDQQWPDTQYATYEYPAPGGKPKQLVYEQRTWSPYVQETHENGNAFYGTQGMMILGKKSGYLLYGPRNQLREEVTAQFALAPHLQDFVDAVRTGRRPHADVEIGHLSSALSHLGNIATRLGRTLQFLPDKERFADDKEADAMLTRTYRQGHWAIPKGV